LEKEHTAFHSKVAKLLFLAKRARPDILAVVSFFCTWIQEATKEDESKLSRVLEYLKHTQEHVLVLHRQMIQSEPT
jgi:hypothetical protein